MIDQEALWRGTFGDEYNERNAGRIATNLAFFAKALARTNGILSVVEFGAGTGNNIIALRELFPALIATGIEINKSAYDRLCEVAPGSMLRSVITPTDLLADLVLAKGILIHCPPDVRPVVYHRMMDASTRYILIAEYYSPRSEMVTYRGQANAMWKADFVAEISALYPSLRLLDYGFQYHRDPNWPQDDLNWFLLEKLI